MIESTAPCTMPHKTSYIRVIQRRRYKLYLQALVLQHVFHGYHCQRKKVSGTVWKRLCPWIMQTFVIQSSVKRTSKHSDIINKNTAQDSRPDSLPITRPFFQPLTTHSHSHRYFLTEPTDCHNVTVPLLANEGEGVSRGQLWRQMCGAVFQPANSAVPPSPCSHRPMDDSTTGMR